MYRYSLGTANLLTRSHVRIRASDKARPPQVPIIHLPSTPPINTSALQQSNFSASPVLLLLSLTMSEATLRSATGAYIGRTSLDNDSRPSPKASPHLPSAILHKASHDEIQPIPEDEQSMVTRPRFSPFYTLINDTGNSTTHHPVNVHYIFSDDDTDTLTTACLAAVPGPSSQSSSGLTARSPSSSMQSPSKELPQSNSRPGSKGGPTASQSQTKEPERRTILIDLDETGTHIASAQSLTSSWQVMDTSLSAAPTWGEGPSADGGPATARYMLTIEGLSGIKPQAGIQQGREVAGDDFKTLAEEFDKRIAMLRTVVEAGDRRLGIDRESEDFEHNEESERRVSLDKGMGNEVER